MNPLSYLPVFAFLLAVGHQCSACTAFCLKTGNDIVLAKNLDWEIEHGYLFLNERGVNKKILNTDGFNKDVFNWQSEYRSITFNQFGKEFPLGGMNEQGLVIEELNMSSVTLIPDSTKQLINEFQLVQYLLDKCKSVDDVVRELKKFQCKPLFQSLHYLIADHSGDVIIAEFNGSDFNIYFSDKTGFPVLSNNNYTESLKYLSYFQGFGGELPVKNRQGSNERFVSVSNLLAKYKDQPPVSYSFQILETVKQIDTRWSLVYDIENLRVSLKFHSCETLKVFDFKNLLELESISGLGGNLANCNFVGDDKINAVTTDENFILIQTVFSQYANLEKSDINYNLLNQMSLLGNRNLKGITNEE